MPKPLHQACQQRIAADEKEKSGVYITRALQWCGWVCHKVHIYEFDEWLYVVSTTNDHRFVPGKPANDRKGGRRALINFIC
jgi:hypothetical protein